MVRFLSVLAIVVFLALFVWWAATYQDPPPGDFNANVPDGGHVIWTENTTYGQLRVLSIDGCAIVQEWRHGHWTLSDSSAGSFGGTNGITNISCGAN